MLGECNISSFCFYLQKGGFKIFLRGPRDEKILLRSSTSWKKGMYLRGVMYGCVEFVVF